MSNVCGSDVHSWPAALWIFYRFDKKTQYQEIMKCNPRRYFCLLVRRGVTHKYVFVPSCWFNYAGFIFFSILSQLRFSRVLKSSHISKHREQSFLLLQKPRRKENRFSYVAYSYVNWIFSSVSMASFSLEWVFGKFCCLFWPHGVSVLSVSADLVSNVGMYEWHFNAHR